MNPSPQFAREAERLLARGNAVEAAALCEAGVARWPDYAAGSILLARARLAAGSTGAAREAAERGRACNPDLAGFRDLLEKIDAVLRRSPDGDAHDLEALAHRLEGAVIPRLDESTPIDEPAATDAQEDRTRFVTPTLAAIYERQGLTDAAIEAYERLAAIDPARRTEFESHLADLRARRTARPTGERA